MVRETAVLAGVVVAELPQQLFRLESEGENPEVVIASLSSEHKRLGLTIRTGQRVRFKKSARDPHRAIIVDIPKP